MEVGMYARESGKGESGEEKKIAVCAWVVSGAAAAGVLVGRIKPQPTNPLTQSPQRDTNPQGPEVCARVCTHRPTPPNHININTTPQGPGVLPGPCGPGKRDAYVRGRGRGPPHHRAGRGCVWFCMCSVWLCVLMRLRQSPSAHLPTTSTHLPILEHKHTTPPKQKQTSARRSPHTRGSIARCAS